MDGGWVRTQDAYQVTEVILQELTLKSPQDMLVKDGILYIADTGNGKVILYELATKTVTEWGVGELTSPAGLFLTEDKQLYVADNAAGEVVLFNENGQVTQRYGRPTTVTFGSDATYRPSKLVVNNSGTIYVVSEGSFDGMIQLDFQGEFLGYFGYNNNQGNWIDVNHPSSIVTKYIPVGKWTMVTVTLSRSSGITIYIDGARKLSSSYKFSGSQNGKDITTRDGFNYNEIADFITKCPDMYFGYGSFWGSADICYDDLLVYNRVLSSTEVLLLKNMYNRVANFANKETSGIEDVHISTPAPADNVIYDLMGRKVMTPMKGHLYIRNGKKFIAK